MKRFEFVHLSMYGYSSSSISNSPGLNIGYDWVSQGLPFKRKYILKKRKLINRYINISFKRKYIFREPSKHRPHLSPKRGRSTQGWRGPSPDISGDDLPSLRVGIDVHWWKVPPLLFKHPNPSRTLVVGMCRTPLYPCHP